MVPTGRVPGETRMELQPLCVFAFLTLSPSLISSFFHRSCTASWWLVYFYVAIFPSRRGFHARFKITPIFLASRVISFLARSSLSPRADPLFSLSARSFDSRQIKRAESQNEVCPAIGTARWYALGSIAMLDFSLPLQSDGRHGKRNFSSDRCIRAKTINMHIATNQLRKFHL